ncbi:MAG TPA: AI-2E family transporter [Steroidobacteraceae bacterium]|nr:AI-2E family transporter [Steroidobacteraceae bacterium]
MPYGTDSRMLRRWFAVAVVALVVLAIWLVLRPFILPIAWAGILAFLMLPLQTALTRRFRGRATLAAALLTALTPIAIVTPLSLLALAFGRQLTSLGAALQHNPDLFDLNRWLDPAQHPRVASYAAWLAARFDVQPGDIQQYLHDGVQQWAGRLARSGGVVFLSAAGMVLRFFLMLFVLFFALRDGSRWFARIIALLPLSPGRREALFTRLGKVLRAVVYGCGLTALAQGLLVTIGFAIAGLSGPIVFGVLASLLALLPFGGAALVWVPGVLYLFATGSIGLAIFLLAWGGVVSTADNFIRPLIISRYTPVPTLLVFLGVIGGVAAFGPIGFIGGPVILVLATELLRYAEGSVARVE